MTFEEWLQTEDGRNCMSWPVTAPEYLRNRLWWAFNAGVVYSQFANSEGTASTVDAAQEGGR